MAYRQYFYIAFAGKLEHCSLFSFEKPKKIEKIQNKKKKTKKITSTTIVTQMLFWAFVVFYVVESMDENWIFQL